MEQNISYTEEQDTLEQEQTNVEPEQNTPEPDINNTGSEEQEVSYLGMSDDEFLNGNVETPTNYQEPTQEQTNVQTQPEQESNTEVDNTLGSEAVENKTITAEDFQRLVTSEFTANGRQVKIENPEDIVRLMQMGMNYNKKMEALKPNMGLVRTLKDNGITDVTQLQFLLDLQKGDKAAIAKLLKDREVDTYDLPDLDENPYIPQSKVVSNAQANFEEVLADVKSMPHGSELLQSLGSNTWDDISLDFLQNNPEAVYLLYQDKQSGMYDEVMKTIDVDSTLGRIPSEWKAKPFVELYEFVATELSKQSNPTPVQQQQVNKPTPKVVGHNLQNPNQVQRTNTAPKSASVNNTGSTQNILTDVPDFLAMTDEQFEAFTKSTQGLHFN